jgi:PKD repeat protein
MGQVLIKILNKFILIIIVLVFVLQTNTKAQNTPSNASHFLSISDGVTAPFRLAVKSDGTIYVTDVSQNNVVKYDDSYSLNSSFNVGTKPAALAINSHDEVFVGDIETGIIYKLDAADNSTIFSTVVNSTPSMIFDNDDFLYVVDSKLKQVTVIDSDGNFIRSIGSELFVQPTAITYDSINERIFVSEHGGIGPNVGGMTGDYPLTQIWIFDTNGNQLGAIGEGGSDDGEFYRIQGMTISTNGTIYVVDPYQANINIFEENGTFLNKFGEYGSLSGDLNIPMDVKFDSQGRTLVSSMNTGTIEVYYVNEINPTFEITAVKEIICPGENTDIKIDFTGTAPWTFTYTIDDANPVTVTETFSDPYIFNTTESGIFKLIELSDLNYSAVDFTDSVIVTQNPFPTSTITSGDVEICTGTNTDVAISFTGVTPYTFTYTDGTTPVTINNYEANSYNINTSENGTYEVTYLSGGGGCVGSSFTGTANINVNALPSSVITSDDIVICEGETTDIEIEFTGTAPWTFTHSINGIDQTPVITSNNPHLLTTETEGIYTITALSDASSTGICFTGSTNVSITTLPTSNIISTDITLCEGESTDINIELTGMAPWDLTYTVNGINPVTITGINTSPYILATQDPGLYEVTALIGNNCSGTTFTGNAVVNVNPLPTAVINEGNDQYLVREGETMDFSLELTGESLWTYTYVIDLENPVTITTNNSSNVITSSLEGTYEVIEISDVNCTNYRSEGYPDIKYDPSPTSLISSGNMIICEEGFADIQIDLLGIPPWSITYTKDGLNPIEVSASTSPYILSVTEPGLYEVTKLTDANLTGTQMLGEAIISIEPLPQVNLGIDTAICESTTITLNAGLFTEYLWNDGSTARTIDIDSEGTYSVVVKDNNNCENTDEITILVNPLAVSEFTFAENNLEINFSNNSLNASDYLWDFGDYNSSIDINPVHTYSASGNYNVTLTSSNSECRDSTITKSVTAISTSIAGADFENTIKIYPNPSEGLISIDLGNLDHKGLELEIRNLAGQRMFYKKIEKTQSLEKIDLSNLSTGVYTLNVISRDWIHTKKIILSK